MTACGRGSFDLGTEGICIPADPSSVGVTAPLATEPAQAPAADFGCR